MYVTWFLHELLMLAVSFNVWLFFFCSQFRWSKIAAICGENPARSSHIPLLLGVWSNTAINMLSGLQTKPGLSQSEFWPELAWSLQTEGLLHMSNQNQMLCVPVMGTSIFKYYCTCLWFCFVFLVGDAHLDMYGIWAEYEPRFDRCMKIGKMEKPVTPALAGIYTPSSGQEYGIKVPLSVRKRSATGSLLDDCRM